jgi:hypothetical protein
VVVLLDAPLGLCVVVVVVVELCELDPICEVPDEVADGVVLV